MRSSTALNPHPSVRIRIWVTFQFEAFHHWPEAPVQFAFLRTIHRHLFHVRLAWAVSHDNRQREFIAEKRTAESLAELLAQSEEATTWSCERWAHELLSRLEACECEVSEDGENGASACKLESA